MIRGLTTLACFTAISLASAAGMVACQNGAKAPMEHSVSALAGEWTLESIDGMPVTSILPIDARRPTISIATDGKVSGFAGVNRISSSLAVADIPRGDFKLSPVISTKMAGPPASMDIESRYTQALNNTKAFDLAGESLTLHDGANGSPLVFKRTR